MKRILYPLIVLILVFIAYTANGYAISKDVIRICASIEISYEINDIERIMVREGYTVKAD